MMMLRLGLRFDLKIKEIEKGGGVKKAQKLTQ